MRILATSSIVAAMLLDSAAVQALAAPAPAATRTVATPFIENLTVPPFLETRVAYFDSFDGEAPEVNRAGISSVGRSRIVPGGFSGRCASLADRMPLVLTGAALSPHRPLTIAFWWSLPDGLARNAGGQFFAITGATNGYISVFIRGGPWCALTDSAQVMQVYRFQGIRDHNGIFDRSLRQNMDLGSDKWHLTVFTAAGGAELKLYLDGALMADHVLRGRTLTADDGLHKVTFGTFPGPSGLYIDELIVLDAALDHRQVGELYESVRSLRQIGLLRSAVNNTR